MSSFNQSLAQRRRRQGCIKTGWQQHHRRHSTKADGSNYKSIDDFTLYKVMKVAIDRADRPSTNEQLIEVINHPFDFCKKVSANMELMQSNAAQMATYGIVIGNPQLMLSLLANIEMATKSDYGREFCLAFHAICKKHTIMRTMRRRSKPF